LSRFAILVFSFGLLTGGGAEAAQAYTDEIELRLEEVWPEMKVFAERHGIHKIREDKHEFETNWMEDTVERTRKLLPVKNLGDIKKTVLRRYKFSVRLREIAGITKVEIRGKFQEQPRADRHVMNWKKVKPSTEDYYLEREFFFDFLEHLQTQLIRRG